MLRGEGGNDLYVVDRIGDRVTEAVNAGADIVNSRVSYVLGANVERLALTGTAATNATGNTLSNVLTRNAAVNRLLGGAGNDVLNGGRGNDVMRGGVGNELYFVDRAGDRVVEGVNAGIDTVSSLMSYTLSANVQRLTLTGTAAVSGTGNGLDRQCGGQPARGRRRQRPARRRRGQRRAQRRHRQRLPARAGGNDVLEGGVGRDQLTGG